MKLTNVLSSLALSFLSISGVSAGYSNSTICSASTSVTTSLVSVYGPTYTGVPSNKYTIPTVEGSWDNGPVWSIYIPQYLYDFSSLELILNSAVGDSFDSSSYTLYTGDIGNFVNPGAIYSTTSKGLTFNGRTQDPLLKIVVFGSYDSSLLSFYADFTLELDVLPTSKAKREIESFDLSLTINKPVSSGSSSGSSSVSSSVSSVSSLGSSVSSSGSSSSSSGSSLVSSISSSVSSSGSSGSSVSSSLSSFTTSEAKSHVVVGSTTTETITSCSDNKCTESVVTAVGSIITTTVDSTVSIYTTYCPLTSFTSALAPEEESTVIVGSTVTETITSCSDNKCTESVVTAVGSVVTTTVDSTVSIYTTYCPLTTTESSIVHSAAPAGTFVGDAAHKTVASVQETITLGSTVTVIDTLCTLTSGQTETSMTATVTNKSGSAEVIATVITFSAYNSVIVTPTKTAPVVSVLSSISKAPVSSQTGSIQVSVYEGAANNNHLASGVLGAIVGLVVLL